MIRETVQVWETGEYHYAAAFGFEPNFHTYIHEDETIRPCMIVVPGGGYRMVSPTEGEIIALKFYEMGYQCFVFTYTTNILGLEALKDQPLRDVSRAVRLVRRNAEKWKVEAKNVFLCGFSAGAHLCGSLCVHWQDVDDAAYGDVSNQPTGAILSYPVITSGKYAHRDSFTALLGEDASEEELHYMSLETQVTQKTPPIFLWQTVTDDAVPVENSYLMAKALKKAGVPFAHHVFPEGHHGLSLSNAAWERGEFGEPYTLEQTLCTLEAVKAGTVPVEEEKREALLQMSAWIMGETKEEMPRSKAVPQVAVWPALAGAWLETIRS